MDSEEAAVDDQMDMDEMKAAVQPEPVVREALKEEAEEVVRKGGLEVRDKSAATKPAEFESFAAGASQTGAETPQAVPKGRDEIG